jgi:hypothetical protein
MSSLKERIDLLESDLKAIPPRISVYHDLPFAILRYDPGDEWILRREVKLLAARLAAAGKEVEIIRLSDFLWKAIEESEGLEAVVELERERGYIAAQDQVATYLGDRDWRPLADLLAERLKRLDQCKGIAFLTRVGAMAPGIYQVSKLLDQMHGKTRVTTILCYPGSLKGTTGLQFMNLEGREVLGNYRVKIYG